MFRYHLLICIILFARELQANDSYVDPENHPNAHLLPDTCGDSKERRIGGGPPTAGLYEYPWMALIAYKTHSGLDFRCTGTIINSRYILTAANCVEDKTIGGVRVGEYNYCTSTDCQGAGENECESHIQDIPVEDQKVHEEFATKPHINNNIALLRLKKPIDFSFKNVAPVCLPISNNLRNISVEGQTATLATWRFRQPEHSCVLHKIYLPIVTRNECIKKYETSAGSEIPRISVHQLCADEQAPGACGITSGDPLMLDTEHKGARRIVQYGLSSHGPVRCGSSLPGVYTDVSKYVDWILNNIKE